MIQSDWPGSAPRTDIHCQMPTVSFSYLSCAGGMIVANTAPIGRIDQKFQVSHLLRVLEVGRGSVATSPPLRPIAASRYGRAGDTALGCKAALVATHCGKTSQ